MKKKVQKSGKTNILIISCYLFFQYDQVIFKVRCIILNSTYILNYEGHNIYSGQNKLVNYNLSKKLYGSG